MKGTLQDFRPGDRRKPRMPSVGLPDFLVPEGKIDIYIPSRFVNARTGTEGIALVGQVLEVGLVEKVV